MNFATVRVAAAAAASAAAAAAAAVVVVANAAGIAVAAETAAAAAGTGVVLGRVCVVVVNVVVDRVAAVVVGHLHFQACFPALEWYFGAAVVQVWDWEVPWEEG